MQNYFMLFDNLILDAQACVCYSVLMEKRQRKPGEARSDVLRNIPLACLDEGAAVEFMEKQPVTVGR